MTPLIFLVSDLSSNGRRRRIKRDPGNGGASEGSPRPVDDEVAVTGATSSGNGWERVDGNGTATAIASLLAVDDHVHSLIGERLTRRHR
jgi:hypothetical protein